MKFKVWDKVRCIDATLMYSELTNQKEYIVESVNGNQIWITSDLWDTNSIFFSNRFILVQEDKLPHELLWLDRYWVVEKDESDPLWDDFFERYKQNSGYESSLEGYTYYWNDGTVGYNWYDFHQSIEYFKNNPTLITLQERDRCVNKKPSQTKELLKPISQTYSIDWFTFIISDNWISIPWKWDERLRFKNSKKSVVKKFRQALDRFCDEMGI